MMAYPLSFYTCGVPLTTPLPPPMTHDVTVGSATNVGMVAGTGADADVTNTPGASGANAELATDIATGVITSRCVV